MTLASEQQTKQKAQSAEQKTDKERLSGKKPIQKIPSLLHMKAAMILVHLRHHATPKIALHILDEKEYLYPFHINKNMDQQSIVASLTQKIGLAQLRHAYAQASGQRDLIKDYKHIYGARNIGRLGMANSANEAAMLTEALLETQSNLKSLVGLEGIDQIAKKDTASSNILFGTTRDLAKPAQTLSSALLKETLTTTIKIDATNIKVFDDPKAISQLKKEIKDIINGPHRHTFLAAFEKETGKSFTAHIGELIRSPEQRRSILALLPKQPLSDAQLTYDAFLENLAIGDMVYKNNPGEEFQSGQYEDTRRKGKSKPLLDYFGYKVSDAYIGQWGFEFRVFTPIPGKSKYKDVIISFRGTEGIAFDMKDDKKRPGVIDTKAGDFSVTMVGWNQFQQNLMLVNNIIPKAAKEGPLLMVGHSLGGALAQIAAVHFKELTRRVVTFQGANIDAKQIKKLEEYNKKHPEKAIKATHYRVDGDSVPMAGEKAIPGEIHYFDAEWRKKGTNQPFGSSFTERLSSGHTTPMLSSYLQDRKIRPQAKGLQILKEHGIKDELQFKDKDAKEARVTYGGHYTTENDPRMMLEPGRVGLASQVAKASKFLGNVPKVNVLSNKDMFLMELPYNTLLDNLEQLAKQARTYPEFERIVVHVLRIADGNYKPVKMKVADNDKELGKQWGLNSPDMVEINREALFRALPSKEVLDRNYPSLYQFWKYRK